MQKTTLSHAGTVQKLAKNGMSQREIARMTDLSLSTVNRLVNYNPVQDTSSFEYFDAHMKTCRGNCRDCLESRLERYLNSAQTYPGKAEQITKVQSELAALQ
jgi:IS30 family transposase